MIIYKKKYIELAKLYHKLHAELSELTIKLDQKIDDTNLKEVEKYALTKIINKSAKKIQVIDARFSALMKVDWIPFDSRITLDDLKQLTGEVKNNAK